MSRRQTLGALSPNQLATRQTQAPARVSKEGKATGKVQGARPSLVPRQDKPAPDRRSSAYGKASGIRQDPRPLGDKNYFNNCVRTVITYLSTHNYPGPLSPKTLTTPTGKEFTSIVQFLFQKFDPNLKSIGKVEDEVPLFLKRINYPFQISKSALFAVGSPHSWPAVLAALTWMVELLNYQDKAEEGTLEGFDDKQRSEREFLEYISTSYKYFLAGDDGKCQSVDEAMSRQFQEKEAVILEELRRLSEVNTQLKGEVDALRTGPTPLQLAQQKRSELVTDGEKFQQLIDNLQSLKQTFQRKLQERQTDLAGKKEQVAAVKKDNEDLAQRISQQTLSRADVNRMNHERTKQKEILESATLQREALEKKVFDQEVQGEKLFEGLEQTAQEYNTTADRLQLIPAAAKRANGVFYELHTNRQGTTAQEIINLDLKGGIKPGLTQLRAVYRQKAAELSEDVLGLREQLDLGLEAITERAEDIANLENQVARLESQYKAVKDKLEEGVRATSCQAQKIQEEVSRLRNASSASLIRSEERVRSMQEELEQTQRACEAEISQLQRDLNTALEMILHHQMSVRQVLQATSARMNTVLDEVRDTSQYALQ